MAEENPGGQEVQMLPTYEETVQLIGGEYNTDAPPLDFKIHGRPAFTYGDIQLNGNEVLADGTSMLWMDSSLEVSTECYGGCAASCMRTCSGESCCMNNYKGVGELTVGFEEPGDMLSFGVTRGHGWALTARAFVAGTTNLQVSAKFSGCAVCCCTDEGPFLTTIKIDDEAKEDQGVFLAGSYGFLEKHDVDQGKKLYVARGNFFAAHSDKELSIALVGGLMNFCCGALGRSIMLEFEGPCTVYTQSRNPMDLKRMQEAARRAQQQQNNGGGNGGAGGDAGGE